MEEMENRILEILNDPQKMAQVMDVAKGLGLSPPDPAGDGETAPTAIPSDSRQQELLRALSPYLRPARRKKLEQAMRMAGLARLAGLTLTGNADPK